MTASVTTIDFDDVDNVLSAPGDLTVLDEEGETQPLTSYGKTKQTLQKYYKHALNIYLFDKFQACLR